MTPYAGRTLTGVVSRTWLVEASWPPQRQAGRLLARRPDEVQRLTAERVVIVRYTGPAG